MSWDDPLVREIARSSAVKLLVGVQAASNKLLWRETAAAVLGKSYRMLLNDTGDLKELALVRLAFERAYKDGDP